MAKHCLLGPQFHCTPSAHPYCPKVSKKCYKLELYCLQNVPSMSRRNTSAFDSGRAFSPSAANDAPARNDGKNTGGLSLLMSVLVNAAMSSTRGGGISA